LFLEALDLPDAFECDGVLLAPPGVALDVPVGAPLVAPLVERVADPLLTPPVVPLGVSAMSAAAPGSGFAGASTS
jgi:hypothetical protein